MIYCYRCTHVGFVNSPKSAAPWTACKVAFIQDPLQCKPSTTAVKAEPGKVIGVKLYFLMNHVSVCGTMMAAFVLDAILINATFQSALST